MTEKKTKTTAASATAKVPRARIRKAAAEAAAKKKKAAEVEKAARMKKSAQTAARNEKLAGMRERQKTPKSVAEQKALREKTPLQRFFETHSNIPDLAVVPFASFSLVVIISLCIESDRPAARWCVNFSKDLFGAAGILFFSLLLAFCLRLWLRNFKRFKKVPYKMFLFFLGLFMFFEWMLQHTANRAVPPGDPREAGGGIADFIDRLLLGSIGSAGTVIVMILCIIFFIWQIWRYFVRRENEAKGNKDDVPVRVYWENVYTAADAEEEEPEALTGDIEADFRSSIGLLTAEKPEEPVRERPNVFSAGGSSLRRLRDTFVEISRPVPDKESMVPESVLREEKRVQTAKRVDEEAEKKKIRVPRRQAKPDGPALTEIPAEESPLQKEIAEVRQTAAALEEEPVPEEPVFSRHDHRGSGLLSAPAPIEPEPEPEPQPVVKVRTRKIELDETSGEMTATQEIDYSFVPTVPVEEKTESCEGKPVDPWILPTLDQILDPLRQYKGTTPDDPAVRTQAEKIERLLDTFGAPSQVVDIQCGPTFSQFGVEPGFVERGGRKTRVRIKQIENLKKDLEMELSVKQLSIEAPIPGKTYVGVQVQNKTRIPVSLREVLESEDFRSKKRELGIALGKDINGAIFGADLTRMPHLLIAGATGSGKSVCLNAILATLLMYNSPDRLKLILVDPKRVELTGYNGIPHLITPVVADIEAVSNVLQGVLREMDMRNLHFMENGVRNIQEYNRKFPQKALPYIVLVIDELANLMMEAASDVETSIVRLAQTARAMGIHLIVATQRPSRDVITGTIKGNLPTRIAFAVASYVDSQVILDRTGAENLFGKGDMYFLSTEETSLKRLQCVYVSDDEIKRIVNYWQSKPRVDNRPENNDPDLVRVPQPVTERVVRAPELHNGMLTQLSLVNEKKPPLKPDGDMLYPEAVKLVQRAGRASANMLVSRLSIGYSRANKLLARMENEGIIGPPNPNPAIPREVLDYGEYGPQNDGEKA